MSELKTIKGEGFKKIKFLIEGIIDRNSIEYSQPLIDELLFLDKQAEQIAALQAELEGVKEINALYQKALWKIANPMAALVSEAEAVGARLDGSMANAIANDVSTLKQWAESVITTQTIRR